MFDVLTSQSINECPVCRPAALTRRTVAVLAGAILVGACDRRPVAETAPEWRLEEVAAFSGLDLVGPFRAITSVAIHADGRVAVVDTTAKRVVVYRVGGTRGTPAGSFGAGPGQYKTAVSAAWISDTLAVYDPELSRIVFYGTGLAAFAETFALNLPGAAFRLYPVSADKVFLRTVIQAGSGFRPGFVGFAGRTPLDTIPIADAVPVATGTLCKTKEGAQRFFDWPEAALEFAVPVNRAGAIVHVRAADYRVAVRSPAGDTSARFHREFDRIAFPRSEWDAAMGPYLAYISENGTSNCYPAPVRSNARVPVRAVATSSAGEVWITRLASTGLKFDVIDAAGSQRAVVNAPAHDTSIPVASAGDYLALVTREASGAQIVRVYRMAR